MDLKQKLLALLLQTTLFPEDIKAGLVSNLPTMEDAMVSRLLATLEDYEAQKHEIEMQYTQSLKELSNSYVKKLQEFSRATQIDLRKTAERMYETANEEEKESLLTQI